MSLRSLAKTCLLKTFNCWDAEVSQEWQKHMPLRMWSAVKDGILAPLLRPFGLVPAYYDKALEKIIDDQCSTLKHRREIGVSIYDDKH
jgi:hypothetical protein